MSEARKKIIDDLFMDSDKQMVDDFVALMSDPRFYEVKFDMIRSHIPGWDELKLEDLHTATKRYVNEKNVPRLTKEYEVRHSVDRASVVRDSVDGDSQDEEASHSQESIIQGIKSELTLVFDILKTLPFLWVANDDKDDDARSSDSSSLSKSVIVPPQWTVPAAADAYEFFLITTSAAPSASIQNLPICRPRMLS
eukprot:CAMPEP_0172488338 /NCGR_PEP_ID=MMETSP1066-20121228/17803_1 /TAXON_ID=671091 /ORGANISM="Coscinodiscus wailesii, Strain CCMP2513" /LENGTH=194 /DNA_ID=CAMNT_0013255503 /DNA_START=364 /DNA_END=948 /DNA_ORIENTATION=+